ncbi:MAG: hypothetical protein MJB14_09565 [Spirochaetes bacterium]|nr:hypothetical protein [Spirochaetota bacterium]
MGTGKIRFFFDPDEMPTIMLRDSHANTPHRHITNIQAERRGWINIRTYAEERSLAFDELLEAGVPRNVVDDYLSQSDAFFKNIYDRLTLEGEIALRNNVFDDFDF